MNESNSGDPHRRLALIVTDVYAFNVLSRGQLEFLHAQGVELDLFCGGDEEGLEKLRARGVGRVFPVPFRRRMHPIMDLAALMVLIWRLVFTRYDTIVYSTPKAMLLGSLAAAMTFQRRRICFVRGRAYENFTGLKRSIYEFMDALSFALSDRILFVSHGLHESYKDEGFAAALSERSHVLGAGSSNGVNLQKFRPLPSERRAGLRAGIGLGDNDFAIVIPGRVVRDKGVNEALDLIDRLQDCPQIHWFFIGWPEDQELIGKIRERKHLRVSHHDHTDAIEDWLGLADLAFLPSYREGFGSVGIEAAACGLPVLAFDVVGLRDSVSHGTSGALVPFADIDACEAFIRTALENPDKLKSDYRNASEWAARNFDSRDVWRRYADFYIAAE